MTRIGPCERRTRRVCTDWVVVADEIPQPSGAVKWDVYARHSTLARVPSGPNLQDEPGREMLRLHLVLK